MCHGEQRNHQFSLVVNNVINGSLKLGGVEPVGVFIIPSENASPLLEIWAHKCCG